MFVIGSIIFISYIFFYLRIIIRSHKKELTDTKNYDVNDFDGIGNQGRFPDKKPKNRA